MAVADRAAKDIVSRAETLNELAIQQLWNKEFVHLDAEFRPVSGLILAECYFALTDAYKRRWQLQGRTEWTKVAALTAATIAVVKPIRPTSAAKRLDDMAWPYLNPSFAMFAAYDGIPSIFFARSFDEKRRILRSLRDLELRCLDPIITEGNATAGQFTSTWSISLADQDAAYLDLLVSYFAGLKENEELRIAAGRRG